MPAKTQMAIIQSQGTVSRTLLPLAASTTVEIPALPSAYHVLVRVLAVALNPNDHKMLTHFPIPGHGVGCDFCGIVEDMGAKTNAHDLDIDPAQRPGTRVCGTLFPYAPVGAGNDHDRMGAFAEYVVVDSRLLLTVPPPWTDLQGAALGGVGWSTVALAMATSDAMALTGTPSTPVESRIPVLVYGGGTSTGTMAAQLLKWSGYDPIAVTQSAASAALIKQYGAVATVLFQGTNESDCVAAIKALTADGPTLRHALDCITDGDSASLCFSAIARTGGRYACLEEFRDTWRTRRVVKVKEVMGYEVLGRPVDLGGPDSAYTRARSEAAAEVGRRWRGEMQSLLDHGRLQSHPVQEIVWDGSDVSQQGETTWAQAVQSGLETLRSGGVKGRKLVVRISIK